MRDRDKPAMVEPCRRLVEMGFALSRRAAPPSCLRAAGLAVETVNKVLEGRPHIVDRMLSGEVQLVFNTTEGAQAIADSFSLRRTALTIGIPYYTTVAGPGPRSRPLPRSEPAALKSPRSNPILIGSF